MQADQLNNVNLSLDELKDKTDINSRVKINKRGKVKVPRRLIHCSDGILEEYSTDEDESDAEEEYQFPDPATLTWMGYAWYLTVKTAFGGLAVADYLGEKFAYWLGITSPKFEYELNQLQREAIEDKEEITLEQENRQAEMEIIKNAKMSLETPKSAKSDEVVVMKPS